MRRPKCAGRHRRQHFAGDELERLIGSIRRECLDRAIAFGAKPLRRLMVAYALDYPIGRIAPGARIRR